MSLISRKNQVTLPVDALRAADLEPGDSVQITAAGPGRIRIVRIDDLVDRFAGTFDYPAGYLEELRRDWE